MKVHGCVAIAGWPPAGCSLSAQCRSDEKSTAHTSSVPASAMDVSINRRGPDMSEPPEMNGGRTAQSQIRAPELAKFGRGHIRYTARQVEHIDRHAPQIRPDLRKER